MTSTEIVAAGPGPQAGLDDHIYNRLLKERIIFLGSDVRDDNANAICAQMLLLAAEDPTKDIWLYINSPGGSVTAGMAIFDVMQWIPNDVATVAMGMAASMGQFLLSAGEPGQALRHPARAGHDAPALGRHRRHGLRHQDPGRAAAAHQEADGRADRPAHRPDGRPDRDGLRPRPVVHRRGGQGVRLRRPGHHQGDDGGSRGRQPGDLR